MSDQANMISAITVAPWMESFTIIRAVFLVVLTILGLVLIFAVLIQPSSENGMGALTGQSSDTYYSKNRKQSIEGLMKRITIIVGIVMGVIAILFYVTIIFYDPTIAEAEAETAAMLLR